jgi:hypothetical protein
MLQGIGPKRMWEARSKAKTTGSATKTLDGVLSMRILIAMIRLCDFRGNLLISKPLLDGVICEVSRAIMTDECDCPSRIQVVAMNAL